MKIFFDKLDYYTKHKRMTYKYLYQIIGVGKTTFWEWKKGTKHPKEIHIRAIAKALNIPVNKISDLPENILISDKKLSEDISPIADLIKNNTFINTTEFNSIHLKIDNLQKKLEHAITIIRGLSSSSEFIFYIKDINLEYLLASKGFLKNLSLNKNYNVMGKTDKDFFPIKEAKQNEDEDKKTLLAGKAILNNENYLPGSKKKKWALISKYPIFDSENKVEGILVVQIDISDRKKEDKTKELLEMHINVMSTGLILLDIKRQRYTYMNSFVEKITGYSIEYLMNLNPIQFAKLIYHPDDLKESSLKELYKDHTYTKTAKYRIINKNKKIRTVQVTRDRKTFQDRDCVIILMKDITNNKKPRS
ncbi:MAG: PAS domain-containing protein [bacterium]|nr:PAS domain-containing protein [bacterium]